ncbi:hypothetical protein [Streptomyces sp. NPDC058985]|uniref:hypothetical protein n=1 Tax=Streptomyces sp. NPDC058985 TaxID=3346684 RepID=UPI00368053ED
MAPSVAARPRGRSGETHDVHARALAGLPGPREVRTARLMRTFRRAGRPVGAAGGPVTGGLFHRPAP